MVLKTAPPTGQLVAESLSVLKISTAWRKAVLMAYQMAMKMASTKANLTAVKKVLTMEPSTWRADRKVVKKVSKKVQKMVMRKAASMAYPTALKMASTKANPTALKKVSTMESSTGRVDRKVVTKA